MTSAAHQSRSVQVVLISEPIDRDRWLAGEIDSLDVRAFTALGNVNKKLNQIFAGVVGILVSTLSTTITLLISGAIG